ncbi:MAG: copper-binding protein [Pseudomonadota bacterium]
MNTHSPASRRRWLQGAAVLAAATAGSAWAQLPALLRPVQAHGHETAPSGPAGAGGPDHWAEGEVRRVDTAANKVTLRHGDIPDLDMPPMTMVFQVRDPALLEGLQPGTRVRFRAAKVNGAYVVTDIKRAL